MKKISTQSYGTTITSAISPARGVDRCEQARYTFYVLGGPLKRLNVLKDPSGGLLASPDSFSVDVWDLPGVPRKQPFLISNFRFCKVFLSLFNHLKAFEVFQRFLIAPRSFVPSKLISRKKDIFAGLRVSFLEKGACLDFAMLWRFVLSSGFSKFTRKNLFNVGSVSSYSKSTVISDMVGVYFLGAGAVTLDSYKLTFCYLGVSSSTIQMRSLSTPKPARAALRDKLLCRSSFSRL